MASKVRLSTTTATAVVVGTASGNASWPQVLTGAATSRPPSANLESIVAKKEALEKIAAAINASSISVRKLTASQFNGRQKVTPADVATVLGGIVS